MVTPISYMAGAQQPDHVGPLFLPVQRAEHAYDQEDLGHHAGPSLLFYEWHGTVRVCESEQGLGCAADRPAWGVTRASRAGSCCCGRCLCCLPSSLAPRRYLGGISGRSRRYLGATSQSVANTAKRAIVIIGVALALGEALPPIKLIGCAICIGGVLLYSLVK